MWEAIIEKVIATEVEHQRMQFDYFTKREKVGAVMSPRVYQPKQEAMEAELVAVYVEPGAAHLVFHDEIAPQKDLDERYREVRLKTFGRVHDVESVEFIDSQVKFVGNYSFLNVYETSLHWTNVETFSDCIFSDTWNHMLSAGGKWFNVVRGGYRLVKVPILEGDRAAAEKWAPPAEEKTPPTKEETPPAEGGK